MSTSPSVCESVSSLDPVFAAIAAGNAQDITDFLAADEENPCLCFTHRIIDAALDRVVHKLMAFQRLGMVETTQSQFESAFDVVRAIVDHNAADMHVDQHQSPLYLFVAYTSAGFFIHGMKDAKLRVMHFLLEHTHCHSTLRAVESFLQTRIKQEQDFVREVREYDLPVANIDRLLERPDSPCHVIDLLGTFLARVQEDMLILECAPILK